MKNTQKNTLNKILAITGTVFVWLPVLAPIILSLITLPRSGWFRIDYLMPAELFPSALLGGALLIAAALRVHSRRKIIIWAFGIMILMLVGGQALAVITGLASGETGPTGWQWGLVIASLACYTLSLITVGIGGIMLLRDIYKKE